MKHPQTETLYELPSKSFHEIFEVVDEIRAEGFAVANRKLQTSRTRLRSKLLGLQKLCAQARKEIPPVSREKDWP